MYGGDESGAVGGSAEFEFGNISEKEEWRVVDLTGPAGVSFLTGYLALTSSRLTGMPFALGAAHLLSQKALSSSRAASSVGLRMDLLGQRSPWRWKR